MVRGGLFSGSLVRWKIGQLEHLLSLELSEARAAVREWRCLSELDTHTMMAILASLETIREIGIT